MQGDEHNLTQESIQSVVSVKSEASGIKVEKALTPVSRWVAKIAGKNYYEWDCPYLQCLESRKTKNGMIAHINQDHLCKPIVCGVCGYSCFNPDMEDKHAKTHMSQ